MKYQLAIPTLVAFAWLITPAVAQIMLAGGHLPVCTSLSTDQCQSDDPWSPTALEEHLYMIDMAAVVRWEHAMSGPTDGHDDPNWLELLLSLRDDEHEPLDRATLTDRLRRASVTIETENGPNVIAGEALYQSASDRQWRRLLHHLQAPIGDQREQVRLADSKSESSIAVFERFVAMAAERSERDRPLIAVSTASSTDPYAALDFYLQVFEQAGADVVWLPLDAAVRRARSEGHCLGLARYQAIELGSFDRQRVYPERFQEQLAFCLQPEAGLDIVTEVDGLFLNGGDQWLTLHAFRDHDGQPTTELEVILNRLAERSMVLGGTSAGAAVQSARAMVSNGSNAAALVHGAKASAPPEPGCDRASNCPEGLSADSLTYHPPGGLGSVNFAIVDTHFSERRRQLRLTRLLLDSGERYGLGVDETTAVVIETDDTGDIHSLEVVGEQAAWLIDMQTSKARKTSPLHIESARMIRIGSGQRLDLDSAAESELGELQSPEFSDCLPMTGGVSFNDLLSADGPAHRSICLHFEHGTEFQLELIELEPAIKGPREWALKLFVAPTAH